MSRPIKAIIYHPAPPPNPLRARPDTTKIFAQWQSGLETSSGCKQWKLRLRLSAESTCDEAFSFNRAPIVPSLQPGEDWASCHVDKVMFT